MGRGAWGGGCVGRGAWGGVRGEGRKWKGGEGTCRRGSIAEIWPVRLGSLVTPSILQTPPRARRRVAEGELAGGGAGGRRAAIEKRYWEKRLLASWRNGRRGGFKIRCPRGRLGSTPSGATERETATWARRRTPGDSSSSPGISPGSCSLGGLSGAFLGPFRGLSGAFPGPFWGRDPVRIRQGGPDDGRSSTFAGCRTKVPTTSV